MCEWLGQVCDVIVTPDGEPFLRTLRAMYLQDSCKRIPAEQEARMVELATSCGLWDAKKRALTAAGYLVGNVAKEYCNWLDNDRQMPGPLPPDECVAGQDVLDIGCSYGRWLWVFQEKARSVQGIEMQPEYLELGRALATRESLPPIRTTCGRAEEVADLFPGESFGLIFSRLVFDHVEIGQALDGAASLLAPGGVLWLEVETLRKVPREISTEWRRPRSLAFHVFSLLNTGVLTLLGRQLTVRSKGRMHSEHRAAYPFLWWWKSQLGRRGLFEFTVVSRAPNYVFWARKQAVPVTD